MAKATVRFDITCPESKSNGGLIGLWIVRLDEDGHRFPTQIPTKDEVDRRRIVRELPEASPAMKLLAVDVYSDGSIRSTLV